MHQYTPLNRDLADGERVYGNSTSFALNPHWSRSPARCRHRKIAKHMLAVALP
jgi:hypothetical protein